MSDTILAHWKMLLVIWVALNLVGGMPSPKSDSSAWYKWIFGSLHGITGAIPRLVMTLFPQYAKLIPGGSDVVKTNGNGVSVSDANVKQ